MVLRKARDARRLSPVLELHGQNRSQHFPIRSFVQDLIARLGVQGEVLQRRLNKRVLQCHREHLLAICEMGDGQRSGDGTAFKEGRGSRP